ESGAVHLVMELATGVPLRAWIGNPEHDWRAVVRVMAGVAAGLAAAHRVQLVHRDIKPDNILIGEDRARVVDFGLAEEVAHPDGSAGGTPSYMAPEVLAGAPASPASDQFSFGVTLYEALHGERPHTGTTRDELRVTARDAARATSDRAAAIPGWVTATVRRALASHPAHRFPTLDALAAELGRDRRRHRRTVAIGAVALVVGAAAGVIAYRARAPAALVTSCDGGLARRQAVWSDEVSARVRAGLGETAWSAQALGSLDQVAHDWEGSYRVVCEATRVRGEQSDRLLELRMRCLDRTLERFVALADALAMPLDASARAEAASAAAQLPRPQRCEVLIDDAELALPADVTIRAEVAAAEHELDRAWAAYAIGRYGPARTQITALEARTGTLAAPPLRAAILLLAGSVEARIGQPATARALLDRALAAAATAHAAELELAVWSKLLRLELFTGAPARAIEWSPFAKAAAARAGHDGAELDGIVAEALRDLGQLAAARERLRRALASHDPLRDDQRALLELNLGSVELAAGRSDVAGAAFQRALGAARALGDDHPTLGLYLDKLAEVARARGRITEALANHDRSLELRRRALGDDDRAIATARFHRAETELEAGKLELARRDVEAARTIRAKVYGERSPRMAELDAMLGDLAVAGARFDEARTLFERAALLDPRLDLEARQLRLPAKLAPDLDQLAREAAVLEPFAVDHVAAIAARLALLPRDRARPLAAALLARWRSAGPVDAGLSLAVADALRSAGDPGSAALLYTAALAALADEPSRSRLHALRGLAATVDGRTNSPGMVTPQAALAAARSMAALMSELAPAP
ncbi:MAG: hypothetical protein H6Q90_4527, partial [Deltaproteobacteria bacterium]|nr:hypothetical protein [Deltaproteobacteria bacterium]